MGPSAGNCEHIRSSIHKYYDLQFLINVTHNYHIYFE